MTTSNLKSIMPLVKSVTLDIVRSCTRSGEQYVARPEMAWEQYSQSYGKAVIEFNGTEAEVRLTKHYGNDPSTYRFTNEGLEAALKTLGFTVDMSAVIARFDDMIQKVKAAEDKYRTAVSEKAWDKAVTHPLYKMFAEHNFDVVMHAKKEKYVKDHETMAPSFFVKMKQLVGKVVVEGEYSICVENGRFIIRDHDVYTRAAIGRVKIDDIKKFTKCSAKIQEAFELKVARQAQQQKVVAAKEAYVESLAETTGYPVKRSQKGGYDHKGRYVGSMYEKDTVVLSHKSVNTEKQADRDPWYKHTGLGVDVHEFDANGQKVYRINYVHAHFDAETLKKILKVIKDSGKPVDMDDIFGYRSKE